MLKIYGWGDQLIELRFRSCCFTLEKYIWWGLGVSLWRSDKLLIKSDELGGVRVDMGGLVHTSHIECYINPTLWVESRCSELGLNEGTCTEGIVSCHEPMSEHSSPQRSQLQTWTIPYIHRCTANTHTPIHHISNVMSLQEIIDNVITSNGRASGADPTTLHI